ncbi:MAG TPA: CHAT domain-containing protein [Steroidobacteraceae bacterium]|nr:CHAT domain-containing protein [Steroidobacteraceae bacterium]
MTNPLVPRGLVHALATASAAALLGILADCGTVYHMGEVIQPAQVPKPQTVAPTARGTPAQPPVNPSASPTTLPDQPASEQRRRSREAAQWEQKWQQIRAGNDKIDWIDHFRVCALKYRYRSYDELFRCLDLFEAKVARGQISYLQEARRVAPVITGWMRATAYSELGDPELGLKWAEQAWDAVPRQYKQASGRLLNPIPLDREARLYERGMTGVGGTSNVSDPEEQSARWGRDNPAGLDLSPEMVTMSLTAQRAVLYQHFGATAQAQVALADLDKWEHLHSYILGIVPQSAPFRRRAELLSLGPSFAMGRYADVVTVYERDAAEESHEQRKRTFYDAVGWVMLPQKLLTEAIMKTTDAAFAASDIRLFTLASEDASNALLYAESLEHLGRIDQARAMYDKLLAMPEIRAMGNLYWVALYQRALIALKDGQPANARQLLAEAVDAIESVRRSISVEAAKIGFAGDKQSVYGALVHLLAAQGDWEGAFQTAERAKARALVDLLAQRRDLPPPAASDDQVRALFLQAQAGESDIGLAASEEAVRGIQVVAESRTTLVAVAPEAASLVGVHEVRTDQVGSHLSRDELLIDYYANGDELYAFLLDGARVRGFVLSAAGLEQEVRDFRASIEKRAADTHARGQALYERLVRPLAAHLDRTTLTIAPHGALHYLPFGALEDRGRYLIDAFSIRFTPSAAALAYLKPDHPAKAGKLLAIGNPDLGNPSYDLPNAQLEAVRVAALFPDSRALVRAQASKSAVEALGNGFSMLHFAAHGRFDADSPLASGVYLARGSAADGVLTVADLYSLRWDVDLVTLSGCETGLGKVASGDDVIGLTRGLLYAGARSIIASLWEVDDAATEQLMVSFYGHLADHDKREALRLAQIETRASYPEPRFWAAFEITGRAD